MAGLLTGQGRRAELGRNWSPHLAIEFPLLGSLRFASGFGRAVDSSELWEGCFLWSSINSSIKREGCVTWFVHSLPTWRVWVLWRNCPTSALFCSLCGKSSTRLNTLRKVFWIRIESLLSYLVWPLFFFFASFCLTYTWLRQTAAGTYLKSPLTCLYIDISTLVAFGQPWPALWLQVPGPGASEQFVVERAKQVTM